MCFPEIEIDPGAEKPAKDCVHHQRWEKIWVLPGQPDVSHAQLGLRGIRLVHDMGALSVPTRFSRQRVMPGGSTWPLPKSFKNQLSRIFRRDISGNYYCRASRVVVRAVELLDIAARQ